jgi:hypothetical protein
MQSSTHSNTKHSQPPRPRRHSTQQQRQHYATYGQSTVKANMAARSSATATTATPTSGVPFNAMQSIAVPPVGVHHGHSISMDAGMAAAAGFPAMNHFGAAMHMMPPPTTTSNDPAAMVAAAAAAAAASGVYGPARPASLAMDLQHMAALTAAAAVPPPIPSPLAPIVPLVRFLRQIFE